jgi:hypothetical protein
MLVILGHSALDTLSGAWVPGALAGQPENR